MQHFSGKLCVCFEALNIFFDCVGVVGPANWHIFSRPIVVGWTGWDLSIHINTDWERKKEREGKLERERERGRGTLTNKGRGERKREWHSLKYIAKTRENLSTQSAWVVYSLSNSPLSFFLIKNVVSVVFFLFFYFIF